MDLVFCLISGCSFQIGSYITGEPLQKHCIQTFRIWTWLQYFILGGLCRRSEQRKWKFTTHKHMFFMIAVTVFVMVYQNIVGRIWLHNLCAEYFYDSIFTVLWLVVIFTWIMKQTLSEKLNIAIRHLSTLTMGVYIVHPLVIKIISHFLKVKSILASLAYFIAVLLTSTLLAMLISRILVIKKLIEL